MAAVCICANLNASNLICYTFSPIKDCQTPPRCTNYTDPICTVCLFFLHQLAFNIQTFFTVMRLRKVQVVH